jgi:hypothetical protein
MLKYAFKHCYIHLKVHISDTHEVKFLIYIVIIPFIKLFHWNLWNFRKLSAIGPFELEIRFISIYFHLSSIDSNI